VNQWKILCKKYFGVFGRIEFIKVEPTGFEDEWSAVIRFDSENAVKTALIMNGNKLNDSKLIIMQAPNPSLYQPEQPNRIIIEEKDLFSSIMTDVEEKFKELKEKVQEVDNNLHITSKLQEIGSDVGSAWNKTVDFLDTNVIHPIKIFGDDLIQNVGNKMNETDLTRDTSIIIPDAPNPPTETSIKTTPNTSTSQNL